MRGLGNIEKSGFHHGEYVGYADGAWRIRIIGPNRRLGWIATKQQGIGTLSAPTLARLSQRLAMFQFQATIASVDANKG